MYIRVSVRAGAQTEFIREEGKDRYIVAVREPALKGRANERVLELVRTHLCIHLSRLGKRYIVRIASGHHSPHKLISIDEVE